MSVPYVSGCKIATYCRGTPSILLADRKEYPSQSRLPVGLQFQNLGAALTLAEACSAKFEEPATSSQELEDKADEALGSLFLVHLISQVDPATPAELEAMASCVIKKEHMSCLTKRKHQN